MRSTVIGVSIVTVICLAICVLALLFVNDVTEKSEDMRAHILELVDSGRDDEARHELSELKKYWKSKEKILEIITSHEDIHDVSRQLAEAEVTLSEGEYDDFIKSMAALSEMLEHIYQEEQLRITNIF